MAKRIFRWTTVAALAAFALALGAAVLLVRTGAGHETLLRLALRRASSAVAGSVEVGGIRAGNLLRGFTLQRVRIADAEARPVFEADSVQVRYSVRDLLRREIVLVPTRIWGMRVVIESPGEGEPLNVQTLFGSSNPGEPASAGTPGRRGPSVALREVEIHRGEVTVRLPAGDGGGDTDSPWVVEEVPGREGRFRVLRFTGIDARIAEAELVRPAGGPRIVVDRLSFSARVLATPFRVAALTGEIEVEPSAVTVRADPIQIQGSPFTGRVRVGWGATDGSVGVVGDLSSERASLADFRWIAPGLPDGEGPIAVSVAGPLASSQWRVRSTGFRMGGSSIGGIATLRLGDPIAIADAEFDLAPFRFADLDAWLGDSIGVPGSVRGRVRADGDLDRLQLAGTLAWEDGSPGADPVGVTFDGGLALGEAWAFSGLSVTLDPFRWGALTAFVPGLAFEGEGRVEATLYGSPAQGLGLDGRLEHGGNGWPHSSVSVSGTVRDLGETWDLALASELDSLSLQGIGMGAGSSAPLAGTVRGRLVAEGPLEELLVTATLASESGAFDGYARMNARDPFRQYRIEGTVRELQLSAFAPDLPGPTVVSGDLVVDGEGNSLETLAGSASLRLARSRIAGLDLDAFAAEMSAVDGSLVVEEFRLESPVLEATGSGSLPLREDRPSGEVAFLWSTPSLAALRPVLLPDEAPEADTLTLAEREILGMEVVDPPDEGPPRTALDGRARGELHLVGAVTDLTFDGFVEGDTLAYREIAVAGGRADFRGAWAEGAGWEVSGAGSLAGVGLGRFDFDGAEGEFTYRPGSGAFDVALRRGAGQTYEAAGDFRHDSLGVDLALDRLELGFDSVRWGMAAPTNVRIADSRVEVDYLRVVRRGGGPEETRIDASGFVDPSGESRFRVQLSGVDMDRVAALLQTEELPRGTLHLSVDVAGPAATPGISATVRVDDFAVGGARLSRVDGILDYRDRVVVGELVGTLDGRTLLNLAGRVPLDLSLAAVEDRFPEGEMDVTLTADSLPAATLLSFVEALEDVRGSVGGRIHFGGNLRAIRPNGRIELRGASVFLAGLGIRPSGITADLDLLGDSVSVLLTANSGGTARIQGTVEFQDLSDPRFDLAMSSADFEPVNRRDIVMRAGADIHLGGSYTAPVVTGSVRVTEGDLFLDEFIRAAQVVDLSDPSLLDVVDTTLVAVRPVVAAQNPFLRNLRMEVDLSLPSDFWLRSRARSREMEVEIAGDLGVSFDRGARDLFLTGSLEAVRGTYTLYGKQFQVQSGSVMFAGTPGLDPTLDIQAETRIRPQNAQPLNLAARVQGTLTAPRVTLTSDAQPAIAESDLISYLIFGRPGYALARGEQDQLGSSLREAGLTLGTGWLTSGVGTELARQLSPLGIDYVAFTPVTPPEAGLADSPLSDLGQLHRNTQVEIGRYWHPFFVAVVLPPLNASVDANPGARVEVQLSDRWVVEGYVEDRFARGSGTGLGTFGTRLSSVMGLALFREWGY